MAKPEIPEATHDVSGFPIPEDDILAVSQRLMFCGRQKDVAELRSWLRQFDDEARIEVAFLLLKRLAEKGFINEGSKSLALGKLDEIVRARRLQVGSGAWKIERGRLDNLCLTYVDSRSRVEPQLAVNCGTCCGLARAGQPAKSATGCETIWRTIP